MNDDTAVRRQSRAVPLLAVAGILTEATYVVTYARLPPAALDPGTTLPPATGCDLR